MIQVLHVTILFCEENLRISADIVDILLIDRIYQQFLRVCRQNRTAVEHLILLHARGH